MMLLARRWAFKALLREVLISDIADIFVALYKHFFEIF